MRTLIRQLSFALILCYTSLAYSSDSALGTIDTIYADRGGAAASLWITHTSRPNQAIQIRDFGGKIGSGVYSAVLNIVASANFPVVIDTAVNSQYPSTLEMTSSYAINTAGIGTQKRVTQIQKIAGQPTKVQILTSSGFIWLRAEQRSIAAVAAQALVNNSPVSWQEECVAVICSGRLNWIQIGSGF